MHVAVMGSGAVGGYFGAKLAHSGVEVTLIARGAHRRAIEKSGLKVRSPEGDFVVNVPCTDDPRRVGPVDLVLFTVKSHSTGPVAELIKPLVGPESAVLCLQNGVENEQIIADAVGRAHVLAGVAYVGSEVSEPGRIVHESRGEIIFGELDGGLSDRTRRIESVFHGASVPCQAVEDIVPKKWQKFLFNCALNAMTAITGTRLSTIMNVPESRRFFERTVREVEALARCEGIALPEDVTQQVMDTADRMDIRSSMQADLERGRRIELDTFNGHVLRLAEKHGRSVPANEALVALLKAIVAGRTSA